MAICLALFPPSTKFHSYLSGYIARTLENPECEDKVSNTNLYRALVCNDFGRTPSMRMRSSFRMTEKLAVQIGVDVTRSRKEQQSMSNADVTLTCPLNLDP